MLGAPYRVRVVSSRGARGRPWGRSSPGATSSWTSSTPVASAPCGGSGTTASRATARPRCCGSPTATRCSASCARRRTASTTPTWSRRSAGPGRTTGCCSRCRWCGAARWPCCSPTSAPLPVGWVCELLRQLLDALDAVHAAGLVHRDVKPGNVLLDATGAGRPHLWLSDFGAAAQVDGPRLTRADSVIGTPGYFAPEQVRGADPDPQQDVYAAAVVATQMLTGRPPSTAGDLPAFAPVLRARARARRPARRDDRRGPGPPSARRPRRPRAPRRAARQRPPRRGRRPRRPGRGLRPRAAASPGLDRRRPGRPPRGAEGPDRGPAAARAGTDRPGHPDAPGLAAPGSHPAPPPARIPAAAWALALLGVVLIVVALLISL